MVDGCYANVTAAGISDSMLSGLFWMRASGSKTCDMTYLSYVLAEHGASKLKSDLQTIIEQCLLILWFIGYQIAIKCTFLFSTGELASLPVVYI